MKKYLSSLFVLILILAGCAENNTVTGPELTQEKQILSLLEADASFAKTRSFVKEINGNEGGIIDFSMDFTADGEKIEIYGALVVPAGAFDHTADITLVINTDQAAIDLFPSPMEFNVPLQLSLMYKGLDLSNMTPEEVDFYYVNPSYNLFELLESSNKIFDPNSGILGVVNAGLPHFSRFAWVK